MMKATKTIAMLLAVGMFLALGTSANAGMIGVNLASNQRAMASSETAGVDSSHANWNNAPDRSGTTANITGPLAGKLADDQGNDSGVTITWANSSANATWYTNNSGAGDENMMRGYIDLGNNTPPGITAEFSNMNQFLSAYTVYAYFGEAFTSAQLATVSNGTTTYGVKARSNGLNFPADYALADTLSSEAQANWDVGNYAVFENMAADSFTITYSRAGNNSGLHGIQIVPYETGPPPPPSGGPLVYESMSHTVGAGQLHGKTADKGLGAWNVSPNGSGQIIAPTMSYTDGNGNVLPMAGNRYETVAGFNDLARASIDTTAWSADNKDGGKLNAEGAEIWFSALMNATTAGGGLAYNHFHLDFTDTANGNASWENGPGYFAVGKDTGSGVWEIRADNDDGDADVLATSTVDCGTDTFILGRFLTDATTGDTVFDAWFNPLLDTAPGAAGTGDLTVMLAANDDGSVTQFDTVGYRHQKWESPNLLDEIRMGETFNSVVGRSGEPGDDIPEPATMAMLGLAVCGLGGYVRRRRKA